MSRNKRKLLSVVPSGNLMARTVLGWLIALLIFLPSVNAGEPVAAPSPFGPTPSARQLRWQGLRVYAFIHFGMNTFTGKEWGSGEESPENFNPTAFDADQIARTVKEAGFAGLILTAKHHDGFCLWPSAYTEHSVKNSPWKQGKGDVVKEVAEACKRQGILFGAYLSPWDRNRADYGKPEYITYYHNQLRELLTNYGPIFEMWFDGANGGDGYYGGAKEKRTIDAKTYYQWDKTVQLIHELQPETVVWGAEPYGDVTWGRSEGGTVPDPVWKNGGGLRDAGNRWCPHEADVSIRSGWFGGDLKSPYKLMELYIKSVGRTGNLLINIPPDRRGIINEKDIEVLQTWHKLMTQTFDKDLAQGAKVIATNTRANSPHYAPTQVLANAPDSYWVTDDNQLTPELVLDLGKPTTFNVIELREYLPLGQRIESVALDCWNGAWVELTTVNIIGSQRLIHTPDTTTTKLRLRVTKAHACPAIKKFGLYLMPHLLVDPQITRGGDGNVKILPEMAGSSFHYTTDGTDPTANSPTFTHPFPLLKGGTVKVRCIPSIGQPGGIVSATFGLAKTQWKVVSTSAKLSDAQLAIGERSAVPPWAPIFKAPNAPQEIVVDLGKSEYVTGFTYLPNVRGADGNVDQYEFYLSQDGQTWDQPAAKGEFGNIKASPILQTVSLSQPIPARYFRFVATHTVGENGGVIIAELGILGSRSD
ncbi:MAG: alpha-L-fucosidase [Verrucomicrobiota bacterium]